MAQRDTSGKLTTPLMILAFLSVVGFMYWLYVASEPTEFTVAQEVTENEGAREVEVGEFAADPGSYLGARLRLSPVFVASVSTSELVWFQFEDGTPYLVRISRALAEAGVTVAAGELVVFEGTVQPMNESVVEGWLSEGVIDDEGLRDMIVNMGSYLFVDEIHKDSEAGDPASTN